MASIARDEAFLLMEYIMRRPGAFLRSEKLYTIFKIFVAESWACLQWDVVLHSAILHEKKWDKDNKKTII